MQKMKMLRNTIMEGEVRMAGETVNVPDKHVAMLTHSGKAKPVGGSKKDKPPKPETASVEPGEQAVSRGEGSRRSSGQDD